MCHMLPVSGYEVVDLPQIIICHELVKKRDRMVTSSYPKSFICKINRQKKSLPDQ